MRSRILTAALGMLVVAALACGTDTDNQANNPPTLTSSSPDAGQTDGDTAQKIVISNVTMYRDDGSGQPGEEVTVFKAADHTMHFEADAEGLQTGQNVKLVFTGVDTSEGRNLDVATAETGELLIADQITGQVSLDRDWPLGTYRLDVYVDDVKVFSWEYTVEE
jgi:hypothetical protein